MVADADTVESESWDELLDWMEEQPTMVIIWWNWISVCADIAIA
jgi:hypothetical protein